MNCLPLSSRRHVRADTLLDRPQAPAAAAPSSLRPPEAPEDLSRRTEEETEPPRSPQLVRAGHTLLLEQLLCDVTREPGTWRKATKQRGP